MTNKFDFSTILIKQEILSLYHWSFIALESFPTIRSDQFPGRVQILNISSHLKSI